MQYAVDVTGLSAESVQAVESLVKVLRAEERDLSPNRRDPEGWAAALRKWAESHHKREIVIDDSREALYSGRGE